MYICCTQNQTPAQDLNKVNINDPTFPREKKLLCSDKILHSQKIVKIPECQINPKNVSGIFLPQIKSLLLKMPPSQYSSQINLHSPKCHPCLV